MLLRLYLVVLGILMHNVTLRFDVQDADIDKAVEMAHFGLFFNMGQCCCAGSRYEYLTWNSVVVLGPGMNI